ncbi:toxin-antitoxin system, toxin component [Leptospira mayottensis]|uniref:Toxin-antitoxin system, toxin component, PIN domain protein n=2 Tax=Leptospira mayottensis TaxID=1137606 RepID=A0AA87MJW4_9LEPT|nr:toxin-antitoxin system, toxin component [Leptospira mayottensis]AXR64577.1 toxin-antitoxin system, toxin component [Leptospira mayottensis]AZQ02855.1 toxin-antitoxin system, toxin component [Leptospira mayottensis 200901116]EKR98415.1 toxin-antitoxin system, toxin component, PIN domain protein [Leptospira mayottensis 200901122]TGM95102.1 toxin-antitoxin system, toxin component [Leptospira mayottensis]
MISLFMPVYIDTSFFLSIIFEDTNYELSYESWIGTITDFLPVYSEIESFIIFIKSTEKIGIGLNANIVGNLQRFLNNPE